MKRLVPFVLDALLVIVFCAIGRRSHHEAIAAGLLRTLWPFGTGLLIGWALGLWLFAGNEWASAIKRFDGRRLWPTGVVIWLSTLIGGMALRVLSGQGIAPSFVLVAGSVLAFFLLGWRLAWKALG
ncbi:DUF3054 domain-containing protein [Nocardia sp. CDC159]|uniref:DUF3054 domain-containing protein n=1 Tax=Nocardia pulmonis TaxID=2951408 RepID=A0A9X2EBW8_9NOCA|nr:MULTISPECIES: DUF3054 domain-containing protein [Nocardia]MCM6777470.1 DUF3054 domain-containing protein [Nocardia pulmonis]MCM6790423.1 DUF3054 domain-containing protein [Nocardia sp. CDC159]